MSGDSRAASGELPPSIGRYRILARLAGDAIDDVYKGFDPLIERPVVVKAFHLQLADPATDVAVKEAFYAEMRKTGVLVHQGILTLFDAGEAPGLLFMAREYVEGVSLRDLMTAGAEIDQAMRVSILSEIVEALEYGREHDVPHLNLKPTNIFVGTDRSVKLGGFGVAPVVDAVAAASHAHRQRWSRYVSPERACGAAADAHSDVYSLGQIVIDLFAGGGLPADESTVGLGPRPPLPAELAAEGVDADRWAAFFTRALAANPSDRFNTTADLKRELLSVLGIDEAAARLAWETAGPASPPAGPGDSNEETAMAPPPHRHGSDITHVIPAMPVADPEAGTILMPQTRRKTDNDDTRAADEPPPSRRKTDIPPPKPKS